MIGHLWGSDIESAGCPNPCRCSSDIANWVAAIKELVPRYRATLNQRQVTRYENGLLEVTVAT